MRLIDADDFKNRMYHEAFEKDTDMQRWDSGCWIRYKLFENVLREQPTVQPEIIRCKDCKHYLHDEEYGFDWCNRMSGVFRAKPDGFCSWAVMRGGDSE